ncbi:hypothetical protein SRABI118_03436 [Massilia sp. Bi118]|uniref:hypothetical protein n=1 Tax=Massilia sp. Bi118 TaxID=2822346 RepID=UPI001DC2C8DE|nr:hypothetical protein [Massilia sp. Bi118]CAH0269033.1 hypothetical protein SRABI118_03436 [Massilia sp. Bi118]
MKPAPTSAHVVIPSHSSAVSGDDAATLDMVVGLIASGRFTNERIYASLDQTDGPAILALLDELDVIDAEKYDAAVHAPMKKATFSSQQSAKKGKLFEAVSGLIMDGIRCFKVEKNVTTTVNQLDLLVRMEPFAKLIPAFNEWGAHFVCECKFHETRFDGDWIDQLIAILVAQKASAGILITKKAASGKGRGGSIATKLQIYAVQNRVILLFSRDELRECAKNRTTLTEIVKKYVNTLAGIPELLTE